MKVFMLIKSRWFKKTKSLPFFARNAISLIPPTVLLGSMIVIPLYRILDPKFWYTIFAISLLYFLVFIALWLLNPIFLESFNKGELDQIREQIAYRALTHYLEGEEITSCLEKLNGKDDLVFRQAVKPFSKRLHKGKEYDGFEK